MKETVTIYLCPCGYETDEPLALTIHGLLCERSHGIEPRELSNSEYATWQQARATEKN